MARGCGCSGSTCGCSIQGSTSVKVSGIGTAINPFLIELQSVDISGSFQVQDSDTLNLTMLGSGTDTDPFILSGEVVESSSSGSFTPTLTGVTLGAGGTVVGSWIKVGRRMRYVLDITFGTSPAITTGVTIALPQPMAVAPAANRLLGWGDFLDSSASAYFAIPILGTGVNSTVKFSSLGSNGGFTANTALPAAVASGDVLRLTFEYLTAS